jgi:MFS family permease
MDAGRRHRKHDDRGGHARCSPRRPGISDPDWTSVGSFRPRLVLAFLGLGIVGAAFALIHLPHTLPIVLAFGALFGGLMSTLYPVCVAHAHDRMPADRVVAVSSVLILLSGFGSVVGPLVGMVLMKRYDINGLFYLMAAVALLLTLVAAIRSMTSASPAHLERTFDIRHRRRHRLRMTRSTRQRQRPRMPQRFSKGGSR